MSIIEEETGFEEANISTVKIVHQALSSEMAASLPLPLWMNESAMSQLKQLAIELEYLINDDEKVKKMISGPLLSLISSYVASIANDGQEKVFLLTVMQEKLISLVATAGLENGGNRSEAKILPAPGACVAIEIHKDPTKGSFFNVLYHSQDPRDSELPGEWRQLRYPNCSDDCPLDHLERLIERYGASGDVCSSSSPSSSSPSHSLPPPPPPAPQKAHPILRRPHQTPEGVAAIYTSDGFPTEIYSETSSGRQ